MKHHNQHYRFIRTTFFALITSIFAFIAFFGSIYQFQTASASEPDLKVEIQPAAFSPANNIMSATGPTVNGLFHFPTTNGQMDAVNGTPDSAYYQLFDTSYYGSGLYNYFDPANNRLYVALVVDHSVNDMVCGNRDYTDSAGWNNPIPCHRKVDSEYAEFNLSCAPNSPQSWTWQQRVGDPLNAAIPQSNWVSDANCVGGNCATFGTNGAGLGMQTATSWTANINAYQSEYPYATPWPPASGLPWNMYVNSLSVGSGNVSWKSPFLASSPDDVTQVPGYLPDKQYSTYAQMGAGFSAAKGWAWTMVYEWSIDLGPGGANCGNEPVWLVTGLSHHSPLKDPDPNIAPLCGGDSQNDCFPPPDPNDPPQILTDWGDLPDSYGTTFANNGARHYIIASGAYLGQTVQPEPDGQPTVDATGDGDEEDGIVFLTPFVPGGEALIEVTAGTAGYLSAFIDFNNNGTLSPVTLLSATGPAAVTTGVIGDTHLSSPGVYTLRISIPADATGPMYSRFRFTNNAGEGGNSPTGLATSGEVEDYALASLGNRVWDDLDGDGIQDADEPGIPNVLVRLLDGNGDPVLDADGEPVTTRTDLNGDYEFPGLPPGDYQVEFVAPGGYVITQQGQGSDSALDSDADPVTGRTATITLSPGEVNTDTDAGLVRAASIGDRVWLDENGDGIQDAGEAGIANVVVQLYAADGVTLLATTMTDTNGDYIFTDLRPGDYVVRVDTDSMPTGLAANPTYDLDGTDTPHETVVSLAAGQHRVDVDFGYNWSSTDDVFDPGETATGAIGDRVWIDANGDGVQDPGEPGLGGIPVAIYYDSNGDGIYDALYTDAVDQNGNTGTGMTTTDPDGSYIFYNLPAGAYVIVVNGGDTPAGYTQTGDPDYFGQMLPQDEDDNRTTTPIILAPGDVFVNADFGYQPGTSSNLSGTVYFDADANETLDGNDYGIAGVTVALLDNNGNVIATTTTDADGNYTFTGLSAGDYTVWVNDTGNLLNGLYQTEDQDIVKDDRHTVTVNGVDDVDGIDFGYTWRGHFEGDGLIGDTIWLDLNGDGVQDVGEPGLQGVTVRLYAADGTTLLATTVTDANGNYYFGGLADGDYVVKVDTATLPNGGAGLVNTGDPDNPSPGNSESAVTIGGTEPQINLDQDFGYQASNPNTIGGTIWNDANADGTLDDDEAGRFAGVTVVLRDSNGNIVATTTTDNNGDYSFTGLPDGTYTVDVTDANNVLNGYWHSAGPSPGDDNNSQSDPYTVAVAGGETNTTADFGYYVQPAAVGNYIWLDIDNDGIQDAGEPGLPNVLVVLTIEYPNGDTITVTTVTDETGFYSFGNLLLDENFAASGSGEPAVTGLPRYTISVDTTQPNLAGLVTTTLNAGNGANDSDNPAGVISTVIQGQYDDTYDFGFYGLIDTGNLPDGYNTLFDSSGPGHVKGNLTLGTEWDADTDGQPGEFDLNDNDGVVRDPNSLWEPGNTVTFTVEISGTAGATGYLVAWIDWNGDGSFGDGEMIVFDPLLVGSHNLTITIPTDAGYSTGAPLNVRFRLYETEPTDPQPTGVVMGGEVEDYVWAFSPTAVTLLSMAVTAPQQQTALPVTIMVLMTLLFGISFIAFRRRAA